MSGLAVETIGDATVLAGLTEDWWRLWRRLPAATPFTTPAWQLAWWRAFAPGELAAVAVRRRGRLMALATLYVEHGPHGPRLLPVAISASDYLDVLLDPDAPEDVGAVLVEAVARTSAWAACHLTDLAPGAGALCLPVPRGCGQTVTAAHVCPEIDLGAGALDAAVPAPQRRKLRMARHRLDRHGRWRILAGADLRPERWVAEAERLHGLRWRSRGGGGVLADPRMVALLRGALPDLAREGVQHCFALAVGESIVGIYLGFLHRDRALAWLGGLDPAFAELSPGTVLMGHAIEDAIGHGARVFDLLRGAEPYKYRWGARDRQTVVRTFTRDRPALMREQPGEASHGP